MLEIKSIIAIFILSILVGCSNRHEVVNGPLVDLESELDSNIAENVFPSGSIDGIEIQLKEYKGYKFLSLQKLDDSGSSWREGAEKLQDSREQKLQGSHEQKLQDNREQNSSDYQSIGQLERSERSDAQDRPGSHRDNLRDNDVPDRAIDHRDNLRDIDISDRMRDHSVHHDRHFDR